MTLFGIDYSMSRPATAALKAAGVTFVCRYLSTPGNPKNLTKGELLGLTAAGMNIVTVFETTARRALAGKPAGVVDARSAAAQLAALGAPAGAPVYFAVDFDATPAQQTAINAYMMGAASVLGSARVGIYGGFYPVKRALDAHVCKYAWQTYAWSGGQIDPRAHLYQYKNGQKLGGASVDFNRAMFADFGQWLPPVPKPPTPPIVFPKDDTFWTWVAWRTGTGVFQPYGPRCQEVRPNVPQHIPAAWWKGLSAYLKNRPTT